MMPLDRFKWSWERSQERFRELTCAENSNSIIDSRQFRRGDNGHIKSSSRAIP